MDGSKSPLWKRILTSTAKGLCVAFLLGAVVYAVLSFMASRKERAVKAEWAQAGMDLDLFQAGLAKTTPNATAQAIDDLAKQMGVVQGNNKEPWLGASVPTGDYLHTELAKAGASVSAPPQGVAAFLSSEGAAISRLRKLLLEAPAPVWEQEKEDLYQAQIPNMIQILAVQKILAADALTLISRGESEAALQDLEAGWRLIEALNARPEIISTMVAIAATRLSAGVLRRVEGAPSVWRERMKAIAPARGLERGYELEACALLEVGSSKSGVWIFEPVPPKGLNRIGTVLVRPYLRLCAAGSAGIFLAMLKTAKAAGPCSEVLEAKLSGTVASVPRWNLLARIALPNISSSWGRAYRISLDAELTGKILLAREARAHDSGTWSQTIPGIESSLCPDGKWTYAATPEKVAITYNRTPVFPEIKGTAVVLPLRFEEMSSRETVKRQKAK